MSVPETLHTSRDLLIFVKQSTEPVVPADGVRLARRQLGEWSEGCGLAEGAVWPVLVEMARVLPKYSSCVPLIDDQGGRGVGDASAGSLTA